jgi:hypothetical protein
MKMKMTNDWIDVDAVETWVKKGWVVSTSREYIGRISAMVNRVTVLRGKGGRLAGQQ